MSKVYASPITALLLILMPFIFSEAPLHVSSKRHLASLSISDSGSFSAITYNIAGLPEFISSAVTRRAVSIADIGGRLNSYDIAHVQEDFNYHKNLCESRNQHFYRTQTKGAVPFGDGLNTLSKYPIHRLSRIRWNDCTGADCLTPKGFTYTQIQVALGVFIDFYNVHANAYNHPAAARARCGNVRQLSSYIASHSKGHAVIVMGDLNGHYSFSKDNIHTLLKNNGLADAWVLLQNKNEMPGHADSLPASNILDIGQGTETIDKILYRSSEDLMLEPGNYKLENESFRNHTGLPLSDHHPVSVSFQWRKRQARIASM
ncbi:endonuclease [Dyadobacter pollutisoli]|uniref:Endonuclease n=1 Tax=Dyadobacter pollutisoli TaxID=2910158 RepID=A0A9E8NI10_9BACT|nr:endonuclease [Dyadobacter pollutisoli]WAC14652.1 endonuclease [Dyadobacter pollutisoli]